MMHEKKYFIKIYCPYKSTGPELDPNRTATAFNSDLIVDYMITSNLYKYIIDDNILYYTYRY